MHPETKHNAHASGTGHEQRDANVRYLAAFAGALVVLMLVGMLAMRMMYVFMQESNIALDPRPSPLAAELPKDPPDPRLQVTPAVDLKAVREAENEKLHSYGWVQPNAGAVRIPIDRAMELTLQRGLPVRKQEVERSGSQAGQGQEVKSREERK